MEKLIISEERTGAAQPVSILTLRGTIETTNASGLEETLERIVDEKCYRIVVDLSGVTYISSAGWGIFISEIKRIRRNSGDIKLAAMKPEVREVFDLLEFGNILKPFERASDAIKDFEFAGDTHGGSPGRR
ncbi:MAG: STAS domain-containing protein [Candidatus Latescibacteria bacterium]|nr:STAS domain-containing protein [Candidatus Latescibacterota bacterium]